MGTLYGLPYTLTATHAELCQPGISHFSGYLMSSFLQNAYILAVSCTLEEHTKRPDRKSCLSLAQAFVKKASAALEAAAQLPAHPSQLQTARKALHRLVCPCLSIHITTAAALSGREGWDRTTF